MTAISRKLHNDVDNPRAVPDNENHTVDRDSNTVTMAPANNNNVSEPHPTVDAPPIVDIPSNGSVEAEAVEAVEAEAVESELWYRRQWHKLDMLQCRFCEWNVVVSPTNNIDERSLADRHYIGTHTPAANEQQFKPSGLVDAQGNQIMVPVQQTEV